MTKNLKAYVYLSMEKVQMCTSGWSGKDRIDFRGHLRLLAARGLWSPGFSKAPHWPAAAMTTPVPCVPMTHHQNDPCGKTAC